MEETIIQLLAVGLIGLPLAVWILGKLGIKSWEEVYWERFDELQEKFKKSPKKK